MHLHSKPSLNPSSSLKMIMQKECYWILHGVAVQNDVVEEGRRCNVRRSFHLTLLALSISIPRTVLFTLPETFFIATNPGTESGMTIPSAVPFSISRDSCPTSRTFSSSISAHSFPESRAFSSYILRASRLANSALFPFCIPQNFLLLFPL